jgi:bifunctional DNase/RNase
MSRARVIVIVCGLAAVIFALPSPAAGAETAPAEGDPRQVQIENVEVRVSELGPVVLLKARNRAIPVFVDAVVAESIHGALGGQKTARPLTHDLMRAVLAGFEGRVSQVVVTLEGRTFHAALTVVVRETAKVFDSRSSDAIAMAIHFKAPILVSQELLDSAGVEVGKADGVRL